MPDAAGSQEPAPSDEFDRELRELTEGRAGDPLFIEPSAAERAEAGGVRVKEAPAPPDGTRPGRFRRRTRLTGGGRLFGALFAAAILLFAGGVAWLRVAHPAPVIPGGAAGAATTISQPPMAVPPPQQQQGSMSPVDLFDGPPADPFLGAPAASWANGAAGIVAPTARPAGEFTAGQVAAAYATTRKLLIAADLNRQTLLGGSPTALARLLTPAQRATFLAGLGKRGVAKNGYPLSTRTWVTSFAPGSAELIGTVIKVHGTMSARAVTESGTAVLAVNVDYQFSYAVQSPHDPNDWTRVVIRQHGSVDFAQWDDPGGALEPWDKTVIETTGLQCGPGGGYVYPNYPAGWSVDADQTGPVIHPYSAASPTSVSAACVPAVGP